MFAKILNVMPCRLVYFYQRFEGVSYLHLQSYAVQEEWTIYTINLNVKSNFPRLSTFRDLTIGRLRNANKATTLHSDTAIDTKLLHMQTAE